MSNTESKPMRSTKSIIQQTTEDMTEATAKVHATFTEAAHKAGSAAETAFSSSKFDMPETVRSFAEQGLAQTREAYGRLKTAAEEATGMMEESVESTRASFRDVQAKAIDSAKAHADASFELARKLLTVTSVAEAMQLQAAYARERFEALVDYSKDMQGLLGKVGADVARPAKAMLERSLNQKHVA